MSQPADPLLDSLVNDFGGNYVFALDVLEQYRHDRRSVEASWREYFDRLLGVAPEPVPEAVPEPAPLRTLVRQEAPAVAARGRSKAVAIPAILPGTSPSPSAGARCGSWGTWKPASGSPPPPRCARSPSGRSRRTDMGTAAAARAIEPLC